MMLALRGFRKGREIPCSREVIKLRKRFACLRVRVRVCVLIKLFTLSSNAKGKMIQFVHQEDGLNGLGEWGMDAHPLGANPKSKQVLFQQKRRRKKRANFFPLLQDFDDAWPRKSLPVPFLSPLKFPVMNIKSSPRTPRTSLRLLSRGQKKERRRQN